jgi:hypothetical protein
MSGEPKGPEVGGPTPEFFVDTRYGKLLLSELTARYKKIVLTTQDSYQYHAN